MAEPFIGFSPSQDDQRILALPTTSASSSIILYTLRTTESSFGVGVIAVTALAAAWTARAVSTYLANSMGS